MFLIVTLAAEKDYLASPVLSRAVDISILEMVLIEKGDLAASPAWFLLSGQFVRPSVASFISDDLTTHRRRPPCRAVVLLGVVMQKMPLQVGVRRDEGGYARPLPLLVALL
jgi:hypothetical protein